MIGDSNMNFSVNSKEAINHELSKLSDFSRIYYLERLSKEKGDIVVKKYCYNKLAQMYLSKGMHSKSADNMESIARLALSHEEKIKVMMDEVKILIDGADYARAEAVFDKVVSLAPLVKKIDLRKQLIFIYKARAQALEKAMKNGAAMLAYERIFKIGDEIDRRETREKLLFLYLKLGKTADYNRLKGLV
ncbi:MAG: hypothetical protein AABW73_00140 [Nanoarchaeota archaeon]